MIKQITEAIIKYMKDKSRRQEELHQIELNKQQALANITIQEANINLEIETDKVRRCSHYGCRGRTDIRCKGNNCTAHCRNDLCCAGVCIDLWKKTQEQNNADDNFLKSIQIDPHS